MRLLRRYAPRNDGIWMIYNLVPPVKPEDDRRGMLIYYMRLPRYARNDGIWMIYNLVPPVKPEDDN